MKSYELTMGAGGRVTLPKGLREGLGVGPGDYLAYDSDGKGGFFLRKAHAEEIPAKRVRAARVRLEK
jgi:bifunctional DNA-binding transcriptional regulator/antitoxin component of YhaV-PrlF toxin-antitoxin module